MSDFDTIIEQNGVLATLEDYKTYISSMELVKEKVDTVMSTLLLNCKGQAYSESYAAITKVFVETYFARAYENMKKMIKLLEDEMPSINALLVRCAEFHLQLTNDYYVVPIKPAVGDNRIRNAGNLTINYSKMSSLIGTCDDIAETGENIKNKIQELIDDVSGDVPGIEALSGELMDAFKYLKRINNLKASFKEYSNGLSSLESRLNEGFSAINSCSEVMAPPEKDSTGLSEVEATKAVLKVDCGRFSELGFSERQIDDLRKGVRNEKDLQFLECIASGDYDTAFTSIDVDDLSPEMQTALALYNINLFEKYLNCEDESYRVKIDEECKAFIGGVMCKNLGGTATEYASFFYEATSLVNTTYFTVVAEGYDSEENRKYIEDTKELMRIWITTYHAIDTMSPFHGYVFGDNRAILQDMSYDLETNVFQLKYYTTDDSGEGDPIGIEFCVNSRISETNTGENQDHNSIKEKRDEIKSMYNNLLVSSVLVGLGDIGESASVATEQISDGKFSAVDTIIDGVKYIPVVGSGLSELVDRVNQIHEVKNEIKEIQSDIKANFFEASIKIDAATDPNGYNDIKTSYEFGVMDEDIASAIAAWSKQGVGVLSVNAAATPDGAFEELKDMMDNLSQSERDALIYMIYGNTVADKADVLENAGFTYEGDYKSIYDIPAEDFQPAMEILNNLGYYLGGEGKDSINALFRIYVTEITETHNQTKAKD